MSKKKTAHSKTDQGPAPIELPTTPHTNTRWLRGLTLLVVGSWVMLGLHMFLLLRDGAGTRVPDAGLNAAAAKPPRRSAYLSTNNAPWGRLTYLPITISPPLELAPLASPRTRKGEWHFCNTDSARLPALLSEAGVSEPLREKLVAMAEISPGIEGLTIRPTREIILSLSPDDRSALYTLLSESSENLDQSNAFRFCGGSLDDWIGDSPLAPETRKLIEPLVYRQGSFLFFADLHAVEESLPSPEQRTLLVKAFSHESTFLARLQLSDESDLGELVEYWGRGGRTNAVRPILESLYDSGGERSIDITHLLPPFARRRLYTYHVFWEEESRYHRDCHWAALNFFSELPDDRYGDVDEALRALQEEHYHVYGNLRLGDLIAFFDDQARLIHTAVFIADDVLFTKNGRGSASPWMLMRLEHMKDYYPSHKGLQTRYYRRKNL